jgi:peptidoglycan/xylan/chitin deacetylase (PgdA/CDA1 family)
MNSKRSVCTAVTIFAGALILSASAAVEAPFEVGTWGNFCQGAVSHTFDDGTGGQTSTAVPAFNAKGFHMTMFVVTNWVAGKWTPYQTAFKDGHEIGSHSDKHTKSAQLTELASSQKTIQQNVSGEKCVTYAYPECTATTGSSQYYIASRSCTNATVNSATPSWENINSQFVDETLAYGGIKGSGMNAFADAAASQKGWSVYAHHGVGQGDHSMYTDVNSLKTHLDYLDQNRSKIWCETFGNVARYIKERDAASLSVKTTTDNSITVSLTDNLADNETYNFPLSIRRELPTGWTTAVVTQQGKAVKDTIVTVNSKTYVMFEAVPDGGDIVISKTGTAVKEQLRLYSTGKMVLVDNSKLSINSRQFSGENIAVSLFDLKGKVIARYTLNNSESSIALPSERINKSAFFVRVTDGSKTYIEKFMPQM